MTISPEQLEQYKMGLALTKAEIELQEKELETWHKRGEAERNLYAWIAQSTIDPGFSKTYLRAYHDAHKAHYAAMSQLKQLAIARLKSQYAVTSAMIEEADSVIATPTKRIIQSN